MPYCRNCGQFIDSDATFCPECGSRQFNGTSNVDDSYYSGRGDLHQEDSGSIGWWFLGFFIPLIGLVLYLVWKDSKPLSAKRAGTGALVGFIVNIISEIILFILQVSMGLFS